MCFRNASSREFLTAITYTILFIRELSLQTTILGFFVIFAHVAMRTSSFRQLQLVLIAVLAEESLGAHTADNVGNPLYITNAK